MILICLLFSGCSEGKSASKNQEAYTKKVIKSENKEANITADAINDVELPSQQDKTGETISIMIKPEETKDIISAIYGG